jgi:hypothetical protein
MQKHTLAGKGTKKNADIQIFVRKVRFFHKELRVRLHIRKKSCIFAGC